MRVKLGEVCEINMGQSPDSSTYNEENIGLPFFQGNADFGEYFPKVRIWCSQPVKIALPNDILISVRAPIGALNIANVQCCIGRGLAALTVNKQICEHKYLWYALGNKIDELNRKGTGSTFKAINKKILSETEILLPPITEQRKISAVLDKVCDLIALRRKQLERLDLMVKARFVEMFGDPEMNPFGWKRVTIDDVCFSIVRGPFGSALKKEFFVNPSDSTYKVYEQKHAIQKSAIIGTYYITAEKYEELKRFSCVAGDILMSCSGTMGEFYQLPVECERGVINQALCKFTLNTEILPIYFLTYMEQTISNLEVKGSGIQNIAAVSYVKAMPINLPPMKIQQEFADFVTEIDKLKLPIQRSLDTLEVLKKSLMQEYFGQGV